MLTCSGVGPANVCIKSQRPFRSTQMEQAVSTIPLCTMPFGTELWQGCLRIRQATSRPEGPRHSLDREGLLVFVRHGCDIF